MRVAIYVRVSTSQQVLQQTIDQQLDRLRSHVQSEGRTLPEERIFRHDGYSGRRWLDLERRKISYGVWEWDRAGKSPPGSQIGGKTKPSASPHVCGE